jgi:hypothetical protein
MSTSVEAMTQEEIIEMARQAGIRKDDVFLLGGGAFEAFAKLVAAKEREACAKVCDEVHMFELLANPAEKCAKAIRARGQE